MTKGCCLCLVARADMLRVARSRPFSRPPVQTVRAVYWGFLVQLRTKNLAWHR